MDQELIESKMLEYHLLFFLSGLCIHISLKTSSCYKLIAGFQDMLQYYEINLTRVVICFINVSLNSIEIITTKAFIVKQNFVENFMFAAIMLDKLLICHAPRFRLTE